MSIDLLLSAFVTLLVTVDPVGLAPIFISVTRDMTGEERRRAACFATLVALGVLVFFALIGERLLGWLQIGIPAFRIAGGLLLFWIAFEVVFEFRTDRKQDVAKVAIKRDHARNVAAFPLAIPLMAGPGAITAVILLSSRASGDLLSNLAVLALVGAVMAICLVVFLASSRIAHLLGVTGCTVLTRLLGVLLAALAVQFVVDGVRELLVQEPVT